MNQDELRSKLNTTIANGLVAKVIAERTGIGMDYISRFKRGHICLCQLDADRLESFLDKVFIPEGI